LLGDDDDLHILFRLIRQGDDPIFQTAAEPV
jgi:hypothetical protein